MKKFYMLLFVSVFLAFTVIAGCASNPTTSEQPTENATETQKTANTEPIKIGAIQDVTGATGDVGKPAAEGQKAYFEYLNSKGGINGRPVELIAFDYGYNIPSAVEQYKKMVTQDKVVAILGWGSGDTEALMQQVAKDKIPYISGSMAENTTKVESAPYNFIPFATYTDQIRALLKWVKDNWDDPSRNPRVAILYPNNAFGTSPLEGAKAYAREIGIDWVDEQIVEHGTLDAQTQLLNMMKAKPDFAIINQVATSTATILKDAKNLGIDNVQFLGISWTYGDAVTELAGPAAEGFIATAIHAYPGDDVPGMKEIEEYLSSKGMGFSDIKDKFIFGWVMADMLTTAIKNVDGEINGENIKKALESLNNYDFKGLAAPISLSPTDHVSTEMVKLSRVNNGKWEHLVDWFSYK